MVLKLCCRAMISHYLVSCILHIAKAANLNHCYEYGRTIKDCVKQLCSFLEKMVRISSQDLDRIIVLRLFSLESYKLTLLFMIYMLP